MFIQRTQRKTKDKVYHSVVLIENYREGKKVKHRTIATLTKWPKHIVDDLEKLIKGKAITAIGDMELSNGKSYGALEIIKQIAKRVGIQQALGNTKQAKLAMIQIAGRIIAQQSRNYIANEWVKNQDIESVFKVTDFNEDSLYDNLDWLSENQQRIEKKIFKFRYKTEKIKNIFLYDVTSSYFEGTKNELAAYGYNRDKKKGKMQTVIGLMLDSYGYPLTIEVFEGNTGDTNTVSSQLKKIKEVFGIERVIFVGDKGMVKSSQIDEQKELDGCYVVKTEVPKEELKTQVAHDRYKDLGMVEYAFRTMKTTIEEMRPIFVRKENGTKGHVFIVMLSYMITKYISDKIYDLGYTCKFAIESLDKIQFIEYDFKGKKIKIRPTNLQKHQEEILNALDMRTNVAKNK